MPLWDKVKQELDRAGQVAQDALDEGRIRLEAHRVRQLADRAAQTLGYAMYRARMAGTLLDDAELARHAAKVGEYEGEATRLEEQLATIQNRWRSAGGRSSGSGPDAPPSDDGGLGRPAPIDPNPAPPASATTGPAPETATAPQVVEATTEPTIDLDPWRPSSSSGPGRV
jgi:hypothetical protein